MPHPNTLVDDPSVKMPSAVLRNSERATKIHQQAYEPPAGDPPADPPADPAVTPAPVVAPAPAPVAPAPARVVADTAPAGQDSWESRYIAMKGRFDKSEKQLHAQADRISSLESMLSTMQAVAPAPAPGAAPPELRADSLLTKEQREAYGDEFLDVVSRQAREAVQGDLDKRDQEIARLRAQLAGVSGSVAATSRETMLSQLDGQFPTWRVLNEDQRFLDWLALSDPYSGAIRQKLLTHAFERNNFPQVLAFFKGFLAEEAISSPAASAPAPALAEKPGLETFAAPGRAKSAAAAQPAGSPEKPTISRVQIAGFYADVRAGKYRDNEAEKNRLEAMIFDAQANGRVK